MARREGEDERESVAYTLSIEPDAETEILEAHRWYEDRAEGLGAEFERAVEACLSAIERHPQAYPVVHGEVHRALLRRFPYGIFYLLDERRIVVLACLHTSRNPRSWPHR